MDFTQEFTDDLTGMRIVIERDIPGFPKLALYSPAEGKFSEDELCQAVIRLFRTASIQHPLKPPMPQEAQPTGGQ